ncbi:MAG: hypothetical protein RJA55_2118 [Acidobacteriota bacterium]
MAMGYRAVTDEAGLAAERQRGAALDQAAEEALATLLDARGSLCAYIAPGQGTTFWGARAGTLLDTLRQRVVTLDAEVAGSGGSLSETLDGIDQLAAADRRARQYADRGELLLAGDVLFTEVRDLLNGLTEQVTTARYALRSQSDARVAAIRREQAALAAAGIGLWVIVSLMLLPGSRREAVKDPAEWRQELATTLKVTQPVEGLKVDLKHAAPEEVPAPVVAAVAPAGPDLKTVAEICADLSALADIGALSGALARASDTLGAKGLIVWVTSNDGSALSPVSTHGFDARIVDRIRTIDRASANLTAEALRENAPRVSAATATAGAAIAVPMCGPTGPVGVLSAELHAGRAADEASVAIASIFAAQLATLTAPLPATAVAERSVKSAAS